MSTLDRLAGPGGVLGKEAPDAKEFDGLVRSGLARLKDAEKQENSLESRFDLAYGAAHALCLWHLLTVIEVEGPPSIEVKHSRLVLRVPPRTGEERRQALIEAWYREQLKEAVPPLLARWQRLLWYRDLR